MSHSRLETMRYQGYTLFEDETVSFVDNISIIKGMNSNGKSNLISGIQELFTCPHAKVQQSAIRFGSSESVLTATFSDGVVIEKVKKRKGPSSYTMYDKDGDILFSTIVDGQYTPVREVPDPIKRYLNLPKASTVDLFYRKSRDKLLLVDTSGSENYEFLSSSLDNKELSTAIQLANRDRLDLRTEVVSKQNKFNALTEVMSSQKPTPMGIIVQLEKVIKELKETEVKEEFFKGVLNKINSYNHSLESFIFLEPITTISLIDILKVVNLISNYNEIKGFAKLPNISIDDMKEVLVLIMKIQSLNSIKDVLTIPTLDSLNKESLSLVEKVRELSNITKQVKESNLELENLNKEQLSYIKVLKENNIKVTRCSHCEALTIIDPKTNTELLGHSHEEVATNDV